MSENGLSSLKSSIDARLGLSSLANVLSSRAQHFVIASAVLCHRERSTLSSRAQCFVIASAALLSSRTQRNVPSGYGDLSCSGRANR